MALITLGFRCPHHTCLPFQPHAAPSNPTHPISATLAYFPFCDCAKPSPTSGTLLELFFCLEQSLFSQFFKRLARFLLLMSAQMSTPWGKTFAHQAVKAAQITHYTVFLLFVSVFVACVCCLVSWFPLESRSTRTKNLPGAVCQCIPKALAWHTVVAPLIFAKLAILAREPSQRLWGRHLQHFYFVV